MPIEDRDSFSYWVGCSRSNKFTTLLFIKAVSLIGLFVLKVFFLVNLVKSCHNCNY